MSVTEMIGWDLLFKLIERDLKTESDLIVAITHWYLIKQAGFRCLGIGDEVSIIIAAKLYYITAAKIASNAKLENVLNHKMKCCVH